MALFFVWFGYSTIDEFHPLFLGFFLGY